MRSCASQFDQARETGVEQGRPTGTLATGRSRLSWTLLLAVPP
jgi:hypothetical protein